MTAANTISKFIFSVLALCASVGAAKATTVSDTFNALSYKTISLNVATASVVDIRYLSGYDDPIFMLFNNAGNHLISNDETDSSSYSRLIKNLAAGNYTLLVSYCCSGIDALDDSSAVRLNPDAFNPFVYWMGGTATLSSVNTFLDNALNPYLSGTPFSVELTNATVNSVNSADVPEPQSLALFGLALAALMLARCRQPGRK